MQILLGIILALAVMPVWSAATKGDLSAYRHKTIPSGSKTYVTGLRSTKDGVNFCTGALVGPSHVLTTTACITRNLRWASVGSTYYHGGKSGKQFKIVAFLAHPNNTDFSNDFVIAELEKPVSFSPVKLDSAENSVAKPGVEGVRLGWNDTTAASVQSRDLQGVQTQFIDNKLCSTKMKIDSSTVCTRGVSRVYSCLGDESSPVIVEKKGGDVLVGLRSWNEDGCDREGYPSVYARVSSALKWIESVVNGVCMA